MVRHKTYTQHKIVYIALFVSGSFWLFVIPDSNSSHLDFVHEDFKSAAFVNICLAIKVCNKSWRLLKRPKHVL